MKKILIITYKLDPWFDYIPFYGRLKEICGNGHYMHITENSWLVYTEKTPAELVNELRPLMAKPHDRIAYDSIFIAGITKEHEGYVGKSVWEWLKKQENEENQ